jgi:hypothetical protein
MQSKEKLLGLSNLATTSKRKSGGWDEIQFPQIPKVKCFPVLSMAILVATNGL